MMEKTLIRRVDGWFRASGYLTCREVPLGSKKIDLVAIDPEGEEVTAIEGKIKDWKSGLLQAMPYRLCADSVYLAIDEEFAHRVDQDACSRYGVGILAVNGSAEIVLEAATSKIIHESIREDVRCFVNRAVQGRKRS